MELRGHSRNIVQQPFTRIAVRQVRLQKHRLATSARSRTARKVVDKDKIPLLHEVLYHRLAKSLAAGGD